MANDGRTKGNELVLRTGAGAPFRFDRGAESHYQSLWFTLARLRWTSLVLVPADEGDSAAGVATALATVGRRLRNTPVTFLVMAGAIDYTSAGQFMSAVAGDPRSESDAPPSSRVVVAVPPVVGEPLALAVIDAADAVALCVRKGQTRIKSATRTIELVGRDRIVGTVVMG